MKIHRFATFEIDEATREVRAGQRVLTLQPRVFDLLVYLARNRDRVVSKDELLDTVWPDVTVADGSLQRAVSLARNALEEAGAANAIRTYSRQGYRFCAEAAGEQPVPAIEATAADAAAPDAALAAARAAYAAGEWADVMTRYEAIDRVDGLEGEDLQRWAHAAQCAGKPHQAIPPLERAVAAFTVRGDRRRAGWVAVLIAMLRVEWRELPLAKGWYHRAARLLENEPPCREKGYLDFLGSRMALMEYDLDRSLELGRRARDAGGQFGDPDLESLGLVHCGEASLYLGKIREGLAALDEAGASVASSNLSPWAGGLVYCGVIYSCMTRADWQRATQWTEQFTRWSADKGTPGYPGLCQMHRAEVLALRGLLPEAEREIRSTIDNLSRQAPWAEGEAWLVLGDILVARGAFDEAEAAFNHAVELGHDAHYHFALLRFAEGNPAAASNLLAQSLAANGWSCRSKRGQALAYYAITAANNQQLDEARAAVAELEGDADLASTPALQALLGRARAELAAAEGRINDAFQHFRSAIRICQSITAPLLAAQIRCRLASLLAAQGDREAAHLELMAAAPILKQAGAEGLLTHCQRVRALLETSPRT
jgi:DNA-binding winged helix-turn-helix (wHTH) protein/predicted negative regulator of RcsB-dependent stress response